MGLALYFYFLEGVMRMISNKQLKEILRSHKKWLNGKNGVTIKEKRG